MAKLVNISVPSVQALLHAEEDAVVLHVGREVEEAHLGGLLVRSDADKHDVFWCVLIPLMRSDADKHDRHVVGVHLPSRHIAKSLTV